MNGLLQHVLVPIAVLLPLAGHAETTPPAATACQSCHVAERPAHDAAELKACPRVRTGGARPVSEGPKAIAMNTNGLHYGPIAFSHQAHAQMAAMGGGCAACHHEATEGAAIRRCVECHPAGRQRDELDRPDLRGALHRQCMECHLAWDPAARCNTCHDPKAGPAPDRPPRIAQPRQLVYETASTNGSLATFFHSDHTKTFRIACADCHRNAACADCHHRDRTGRPADRRLQVPTDPDVDHPRCAACHKDDACARCHAEQPMDAFTHAKAGVELDEDHADADCTDCHAKGNFRAAPDCTSCHDDKSYPRDVPGKRTSAPPGAAP